MTGPLVANPTASASAASLSVRASRCDVVLPPLERSRWSVLSVQAGGGTSVAGWGGAVR